MNTVFSEKICRCCLNENEQMTNLYDRVVGIEPFTFEQHFTYSDLIYFCTNVRCDLDVIDANEHIVELPRNLCGQCLQELRAAFIFRQKCESSDNLLKEQVVGNHITEEIVEFEQTGDDGTKSSSKKFHANANQPNEKCVFIDVKPITLEDNSLLENKKSNEDQFQIISTISENLPFEVEQSALDVTKSDGVNISCKICEIEFHSESYLRMHNHQKHSEKNYKCNVCSKELYTEREYSVHSSTHSNQTNKKKFLCSICGQMLATKQKLTTHAATHSGDTKTDRYACTNCDKKFASKSRLRCHQRIHTGEKPYRCDQCDLTFAQGNALKCHKRIHTGEKPYECKFCSKRFSQNTILKTHMTLHIGKTVKCPDCDKMFSRASNLILHRREHTGEKPYKCPINNCPNQYKQKSHLDQHMNTHLGVKYICEICQNVYSKRWSLKVHMFTHAKVKPHQCTLCDAQFARRDKFNIHLKSCHNLIQTNNEMNANVRNTNKQ